MTQSFVTRFAPSPTGLLHIGHAYAALFAQTKGARFLLRLEDIDSSRCRPEFEAAILEDMAWLGLDWEQPVRRQSEHMDDYGKALAHLEEMDLLYPCFCTRKDINALGHAPHGPNGPVYPGTCRNLSEAERAARKEDASFALRLDMDKAVAREGELTWRDLEKGFQDAQPQVFGDVVLARKDAPTSYHLAVTLDDHIQGVTLVTRGEDLFEATHVHRLLQALLELDTPAYLHHGLLNTSEGKRLAKRDQSLTIRALRQAGHTAQEVRQMASFSSRPEDGVE